MIIKWGLTFDSQRTVGDEFCWRGGVGSYAPFGRGWRHGVLLLPLVCRRGLQVLDLAVKPRAWP